MANKVQMTPMVTQETRDLVRRTCQEKGCSQGDLVENALLAFLGPTRDEGKIDTMLEKLTTIETTLVALCEALTPHEEAHPPTPPPPPIATYEQMYGPIEAAPPAVDVTPLPQPPGRPRRLRQWFLREERA